MFAQRDWHFFFHLSFTCLQTLLCTQCLLGPTVSRAAPLFSAAQDQTLRVSTGGRAYRQPDLQWPTLLPALPCALKFQPLFYFEHDVFSLHVSCFDYVRMTLLRNLILKWAFQYIGHREHLVHMHKVQSSLVGIWHKALVTFSYICQYLKKKIGLEKLVQALQSSG